MDSQERSNRPCLLEGILSIESAVRAKSRSIYRVYVDVDKVKKRDRRALRFLSFLEQNGQRATFVSRADIDQIVLEQPRTGSTTHGGFVALAGERTYWTAQDLFERRTKEEGASRFYVCLDGVEDPYNFGYALRSLYAAGTTGFFVPPRNWAQASEVCARASAGASELADMALMPESDAEFVDLIRQNGIRIVCAAKTGKAIPLDQYVFRGPLCLFIGGEKRGISKTFIENADETVFIPYQNPAVRYSLPTDCAAAVFGYEFGKQMRKMDGRHNESP